MWFHTNIPRIKETFVLILNSYQSSSKQINFRVRNYMYVVKIDKTPWLKIRKNQIIRMWAKSTLGYLNILKIRYYSFWKFFIRNEPLHCANRQAQRVHLFFLNKRSVNSVKLCCEIFLHRTIFDVCMN